MIGMMPFPIEKPGVYPRSKPRVFSVVLLLDIRYSQA
jgi:hypothetical protein